MRKFNLYQIKTDALGNSFQQISPHEWKYVGDGPMKIEEVKERPSRITGQTAQGE